MSENIKDLTKEIRRAKGANSTIVQYVSNLVRRSSLGTMHMFNRFLGEILGQQIPPVVTNDPILPTTPCPLSSHVNTYLLNESGAPGYCALQGSKGRIIVVDNQISEGMVLNRKYVIAHSSNLLLRKPSTVHHPSDLLNQLQNGQPLAPTDNL